MGQVLVNVTPFKSILKESKERPGVFEVEGVMQRAGAKTKTEEFTIKIYLYVK